MLKFTFPEWDIRLFEAINSKHTACLDPIMQMLSSPTSWIVLFIIVSFFMIRKSKLWGWREIMLICCTVIANSLINNLIKLIIQRPRPCHNESLQATIHMLEDCGTHYSFFSAHSSNAFCLAICTALFLRNKYCTVLLVLWATLVSYSRIYVGKHYPLDVIIGIIFGITMSILGNYLLKRYREPLTENGF